MPTSIRRISPHLVPDWVHEIMHDGYRLIGRRDPVGIRLLARNGHDWSPRYPLIVEAVNALKSRSFIKVMAVSHLVKCAEEERVQFRVGNIQIRSLSGFRLSDPDIAYTPSPLPTERENWRCGFVPAINIKFVNATV